MTMQPPWIRVTDISRLPLSTDEKLELLSAALAGIGAALAEAQQTGRPADMYHAGRVSVDLLGVLWVLPPPSPIDRILEGGEQ